MGVNHLEAEVRDPRHREQQLLPEQQVGQKRPDEQPPDLGGGVILEDQRRPKPDHSGVRMNMLETVEHPFHRDLVPRVEGALGSFGRP